MTDQKTHRNRPVPAVAGVVAPPPMLTPLGAALIALSLAVPGGALIWAVSLLL